jgi:N-methylhydantoinase A
MQSIGFDVGGTFTDIVAVGNDGQLAVRKVLSTPVDYSDGICKGLGDMIKEGAVSPEEARHLVHAATVATNTVITRTGAKVGLITTEGFRDVLEIGRLRYPRLYDMNMDKPIPLVPRHLRMGVIERMDYLGNVVTELDWESVESAIGHLLENDVESIAICLLNAYANPLHEQRIARHLSEVSPQVELSVSSEVLPEIKEYERTSTTVINAYIKPVVARYISNLEKRLDQMGLEAPITVMQSSGGTVRTDFVKQRPVYAIESGPAAGAVGAATLGKHLGINNIIAFDMGGTTAKTCLIENAIPRLASEYEVGGELNIGHRLLRGGGYLLRVPAIDLAEIGAGGGSIAWIDRGGVLRVGPQSAGADPGPACYQRGGTVATVTDANVALGYLNPEYLVGGELQIDRELAMRAVAETIAEPLKLAPEEAALGIHTIVNSSMVRAVRAVSSEIGRDPGEFMLLAFGGSGPVHAATLAREANMPEVIVPPAPGVFSAVGLLLSTVEHQYVQTFWRELGKVNTELLEETFQSLEREAQETLLGEGFTAQQIELERFVDMRYPGQTSEILITVPPDRHGAQLLEELENSFHWEHENSYGYRSLEGEAVEIVNIRLRARGLSDDEFSPEDLFKASRQVSNSIASGHTARQAYFGEANGWIETDVLGRDELNESPTQGPLIIEEYDATIVVPPEASAHVDPANNVRIAFTTP